MVKLILKYIYQILLVIFVMIGILGIAVDIDITSFVLGAAFGIAIAAYFGYKRGK